MEIFQSDVYKINQAVIQTDHFYERLREKMINQPPIK